MYPPIYQTGQGHTTSLDATIISPDSSGETDTGRELKVRRSIRFWVLGVSTLSLLALGITIWLEWRPSAVTKENIDRIQPGMTRAEVEALLGGPPQHEPGGRLSYLDGDSVQADPIRGTADWVGNEWAVTVSFRDDQVEWCRPATGRGEETVLQRLRRWLRV